MLNITKYKIHPSIGLARLGNSPDEIYIGPEVPGTNNPPQGGYKDRQMRVKRQAARFRIFGYDDEGNAVREITASEADIKWTVHLANKKADWKNFDGLDQMTGLRNAAERNRSKLIIDPGIRSVSQANPKEIFDTGTFYEKAVPLGEIRMEAAGQLLVLGGSGHSSARDNEPLTTFANNDGWHDDVSDGPVTATIKLKGALKGVDAVPAWVICPPPDFAPPIGHVVSLYDTLLQVAIDRLNFRLPDIPSFTNDIYPILSRANKVSWVSTMMWTLHKRHGKPSGLENKHQAMEDTSRLVGDEELRRKVFGMLTDPDDPLGGGGDMPMMWSDHYRDQVRASGEPRNQTLCQWQYDYLEKWSRGFFVDDWVGAPSPPSVITADGLDRASLENSVGGPFYPGIETSWFTRDLFRLAEPLRLSHTLLSAGDLTKQMALPWQADFFDCQQDDELAWWPAQRPDDVFTDDGTTMHKWTRGHVLNYQDMVEKWHRLGFVIKKDHRFVESQRNP